jgi:hypothetical protein
MADDGRIVAVRAGESPQVLAPGRVCGKEGCVTVLSRYNRDLFCYQHSEEPSIRDALRD